MSDTPRTDAFAYECLDGDLNGVMVVSVLLAQQLERELAEANTVDATLLTTKCCELAEVTKQRDMLIEGLEKIASCDWVITLPDRMDAVRNIANETLNKIKL